MTIDEELVSYISGLSKLELSEEEKENMKKDLSNILTYIDKLNELNTENVPEMTHPFSEERLQKITKTREDVPEKYKDKKELFENAPETSGDFFKVKKVNV